MHMHHLFHLLHLGVHAGKHVAERISEHRRHKEASKSFGQKAAEHLYALGVRDGRYGDDAATFSFTAKGSVYVGYVHCSPSGNAKACIYSAYTFSRTPSTTFQHLINTSRGKGYYWQLDTHSDGKQAFYITAEFSENSLSRSFLERLLTELLAEVLKLDQWIDSEKR
jgi:hypothetical protein